MQKSGPVLHPVAVRYRPRVPEEVLLRHIRASLASGVRVLKPQAERREALIIAAGGPSLLDKLDDLRATAAAGARILGVNEVPHLLIRHGIQPWAAAHVGPVDLTLASLGTPLPGVRYFIASTCPPAVLERLKDHDARLWHPDLGPGTDAVYARAGRPGEGMIAGGPTVTLFCLALGTYLGFRTMHLYGGDSSFRPGEAVHAYDSVSDAHGYDDLLVTCDGHSFTTTPELLGQALRFPGLRKRLASRGASLSVHGEGLLPTREKLRRATGHEPPVLTAGVANSDGVIEFEAELF